MKFCDNCDQILIFKKNEKKKKYEYFCNNDTCEKQFSDFNSEIIFVKKNIHNISKIKLLAESAIQDDTFPVEKKKCPNCGYPVMKWFRLDDDLKKIYVCEKCKTYYS